MQCLQGLTRVDPFVDPSFVQERDSSIPWLLVYSGARLFLSLLEDAWIDNAHNDETGDDQGESDEGYKEDAAPAGRELAPYDPVLE